MIVLVAACGRIGFDDSPDAAPVEPDAIAACVSCPTPRYALIDGHCYRLSTTPRSWLDAERDCEADGAHLVVTDDVDEHFTLHGIAAGIPRIWIGWSDRVVDDTFLWVAPSAGALERTNTCVFDNGEPQAGDGDHCIATLGDNACPDHFDDDCALVRPYVCECDGSLADLSSY